MSDYEEGDYNPDECLHGVYYQDYCEDCYKADALYEKALEQADWNHWHPVVEGEE